LKTKIFVATFLTFAITIGAQAATVTVNVLETASGIWDLLVELTPSNGDVTGLGGYAFDVIGVPADQVSFKQGQIRGVDPTKFLNYGFGFPLSGPIGGAGSTRFSAGSIQSLTDDTAQVPGIGVEPLDIAGAGTGFNDIVVDVPALIGTLTTPAGLSCANFTAFGFVALTAGGGQFTAIDDVEVVFGPANNLGTGTLECIPEPTTPMASTVQPIEFEDTSAGAVGAPESTHFSVGSLESPTDVDSQVTGIGMESLNIVGAGTRAYDVVVGVPALIGTLTSPAGLTVENFSAVEFSGINAADGQNIAFSATNVNVVEVPIPEPATLALMSFGLIGLVIVTSRRP